MSAEKMNAVEANAAGLVASPATDETMHIVGRYHVECIGADGQVKWTDVIDNLVTTAGKNEMLEKYLEGSSWSTGTVYMGLKGSGSANAADTMASHAGWSALNITANRGTVTFDDAASGSKATTSAVAHSITTAGPTTVAGCYIVVGGTNGNTNTTGTLFSAGDFSGGTRDVVSGDTLNVTYSVGI